VAHPPSNKGMRFPPETLTAAEVEDLIKAASNVAPTGIRNRALMAVLYRCGLRLAEALALKPADIDLIHGTVRVLHGKGGKARTVGIDSGALAIVQRWIDTRDSHGIRGQILFCTLAGRPVNPRDVREVLTRYAARAGITKRVHPHGLRHTHAAELALEGVPVNTIQAQLGHSNLSTTSTYLAHIAPWELVDAIRGRAWAVDAT